MSLDDGDAPDLMDIEVHMNTIDPNQVRRRKRGEKKTHTHTHTHTKLNKKSIKKLTGFILYALVRLQRETISNNNNNNNNTLIIGNVAGKG